MNKRDTDSPKLLQEKNTSVFLKRDPGIIGRNQKLFNLPSDLHPFKELNTSLLIIPFNMGHHIEKMAKHTILSLEARRAVAAGLQVYHNSRVFTGKLHKILLNKFPEMKNNN